ncbi:MAG: squalene synthase HpnC [Burkholderiaceae bacterium]
MWTIDPVSVNHYENFPVASLLCPPALRPAVAAIYRFARTADDLADEGNAASAQRLLDLAAYRNDLLALARGERAGVRWAGVFDPLRAVLKAHALPLQLLTDLLSAFEQDVVKTSYADRADLQDYCRRSANPIGRLLLQLYGVGGAQALGQSDAICTALQLANFWQDLGGDTRRGRLYIPLADCARHGVDPAGVLGGVDSPALRRLVCDQLIWTREMMLRGAPLVHAIPGRAGWELRLVIQGGLRILEKIEGLGFATLQHRPVLRGLDAPPMLWRALTMRAARAPVAQGSA